MTDPAVPGLHRSFDVTVVLGPMDDYGVTRAGRRRVIPILGGRVSGDVEAEILPGGADWQVVRHDGALEIDGRYSARTAGGDLLYIQVSGVRTGAPEVLAALLAGEAVDPSRYYFRTSLTIETSSVGLSYLQHSLFVASCVREVNSVRYTAYRVT